ncbi:MAG: hypothetical protein FKY71_12520 [Spiribacter salinus]|uniref:Uncharacterized protein n=1 Tax=Spiribacter salinus TaxID=1335746 RepID=A0A540VPP8_9GAMM|nr:MAG: hypothetical protein FKY71_12520 [Spiribacter salinus]
MFAALLLLIPWAQADAVAVLDDEPCADRVAAPTTIDRAGVAPSVELVLYLRASPHSATVILYAYAGGDPVNNWDPSGLITIRALIGRLTSDGMSSRKVIELVRRMTGGGRRPANYRHIQRAMDNNAGFIRPSDINPSIKGYKDIRVVGGFMDFRSNRVAAPFGRSAGNFDGVVRNVDVTPSGRREMDAAWKKLSDDTGVPARDLKEKYVWHHDPISYDVDTNKGDLILLERELHDQVGHGGSREILRAVESAGGVDAYKALLTASTAAATVGVALAPRTSEALESDSLAVAQSLGRDAGALIAPRMVGIRERVENGEMIAREELYDAIALDLMEAGTGGLLSMEEGYDQIKQGNHGGAFQAFYQANGISVSNFEMMREFAYGPRPPETVVEWYHAGSWLTGGDGLSLNPRSREVHNPAYDAWRNGRQFIGGLQDQFIMEQRVNAILEMVGEVNQMDPSIMGLSDTPFGDG